MTNSYGDNSVRDILDSERALRALAEKQARGLTKLLIELGYRLDGTRLEDELRRRPTSLEAWDADTWRDFFASIRLPEPVAAGWSDGHSAELEQLRRRVGELQTEVGSLRKELATAREQLALVREPAAVSAVAGAALSETAPLVREVPAPQRRQAELPPEDAELVAMLKALPPIPSIPPQFEPYLPEDPERARRDLALIALLARSGISQQLELDRIYSAWAGCSTGGHAFRDMVTRLSEDKGLLSPPYRYRQQQPFPTTLICLELSDRGKALAQRMGWDPVETQHARILRLHEGAAQPMHTMSLLAFAMHAHLRGWHVTVIPEVEGPAAPDLLIERDGQRLYVEVERSNDPPPAKWRALAQLNGGKVAFCAVHGPTLRKLKDACVNDNLHGVATDLAWLALSTSDPVVEGSGENVRVVNAHAQGVDQITVDTPLWNTEF